MNAIRLGEAISCYAIASERPILKIYKRNTHRFFDELSTCLISTMGVCIAMEAYMNHGITTAPAEPKYYLSLDGDSVTFHWECFNAMQSVMNDSWPEEIIFQENVTLKSNSAKKYENHGFKKLAATNISFAFIGYYESQIDSIKSRFGGGSESWPEVWNFARIVRNALSHNGQIHITNISASPVSWSSYTYSYQNNGHAILFTDLGFVEFILLMEDMDSHLNA